MKWVELNNEVMVKDRDNNYQLHKDKEALNSYLTDSIERRMMFFSNKDERMDYLVEHNYYDKEVVNKYSKEFINNLYTKLDGIGFEFASYMSASKFFENYALKSDDGKYILETYIDKVIIVALALADGDEGFAIELGEKLIRQEFQPATPTFLNAGRARAGEMVSCFLLSVEDSTEGISYAISSANHLSKIGGGVALNLTRLRASKEAIKGIEGVAGGVVGVAKMLEQSFSYFNQMGARQGAGAVYLNVLHPDCDLLLDTKKINADEKIRLTTLSVGILIPDIFMEKAEKNEMCYAIYPHSLYKKYGVHLDEIDMGEWYEKLVNDEDIRKKEINPRKLLTRIAQTQQESVYPYVIYIDSANKQHTLKEVGKVKMSNLCCEIFQYQVHSEIKGYGDISNWGQDISCNLGSLNIANVMKNKDIEGAVSTAIRALTVVSDKTNIGVVPTIKRGNDLSHAIGLGAMNLHGYLVSQGIIYGSEESLDFANTFFAMMRYYAIKSSMQIAINKGKAFEGFEKSEYAKGNESELLGVYAKECHRPKTDKVKALFEGIYIPSKEDWATL